MSRFKALAKLLGKSVDKVSKLSPEAIGAIEKEKNLIPYKVLDRDGDLVLESSKAKASALFHSPEIMEALKSIKENIAEPVVEKYNKLKSYVTRPLAKQMNLSKDPEIEKGLKQGLDMGLDPVNLIPGGAGVGAGLLQLLGEKDEEE